MREVNTIKQEKQREKDQSDYAPFDASVKGYDIGAI